MLNGKELGNAIKVAIDKKKKSGSVKTSKQIADHFGVKEPSLHDWIKRGTISKDKLPELFIYFSDVVGPEHWGISNDLLEYMSNSTRNRQNNTINDKPGIYDVIGIDPDSLTIEQIELIKLSLKVPKESIPQAKKITATFIDDDTNKKRSNENSNKDN